MGGSGGGGTYPPGGAGSGAGGGDGQNCDFDFITTVFGPVPGLADLLRVGDILEVSLTAQRSLGLLDSNQGRQQVGSMAGAAQIPSLVVCIEAGNDYRAEVTAIDGSRITIRVRNT